VLRLRGPGQVARKARTLTKVWSFDCNPPHLKFKDGKPIDYWTGDTRRNEGNNDDGTFVGPSEIIATPVFHKNRVYVAVGQDPLHGRGRGALSCIDATKAGDISTTGRIWTYEGLDRTLSTVSIADGLLYIADFTGAIHCLDVDTGKPYWVHHTKAEVWASTLVADGKVYLGTKKAFWVLAAARRRRCSARSAWAPRVGSRRSWPTECCTWDPTATFGLCRASRASRRWQKTRPPGATEASLPTTPRQPRVGSSTEPRSRATSATVYAAPVAAFARMRVSSGDAPELWRRRLRARFNQRHLVRHARTSRT